MQIEYIWINYKVNSFRNNLCCLLIPTELHWLNEKIKSYTYLYLSWKWWLLQQFRRFSWFHVHLLGYHRLQNALVWRRKTYIGMEQKYSIIKFPQGLFTSLFEIFYLLSGSYKMCRSPFILLWGNLIQNLP